MEVYSGFGISPPPPSPRFYSPDVEGWKEETSLSYSTAIFSPSQFSLCWVLPHICLLLTSFQALWVIKHSIPLFHKTRESSLEQLQVHPHCTVPCAGNSGPGSTSSNCSQLSDPAEQPTASWCPVPRGPSSWGRNGEEASDNNVFQSPSGPWEDPLHFRPSKPCRCGLQHYLLSLSCHHSSLIVFPMLIYKGYFNKYHLSQWPIRGRLSFFQLPSVSISESLEPSLPWFWKCAGSQCTSKDVNYCNNYWFSKISMLSSTFLRQARLGLAAARLTRKLILTNRTEVEMMYFTRMIWETQDGRATDGIISI